MAWSRTKGQKGSAMSDFRVGERARTAGLTAGEEQGHGIGGQRRRDLAVGAEYRAKPDNLDESVLGSGALKEDDWSDLFLAWAPNKHLSITLAWVDLGRIAPAVQPRRQRGAYLSAQIGF